MNTKDTIKVLEHLQEVYRTAIEDVYGFDRQSYKDYVRSRYLHIGICYYLHFTQGRIVEQAVYESYWMRRALKGSTYHQRLYICATGLNGVYALKKRLEVIERELKLVRRYGWFARLWLFNPSPKELNKGYYND